MILIFALGVVVGFLAGAVIVGLRMLRHGRQQGLDRAQYLLAQWGIDVML